MPWGAVAGAAIGAIGSNMAAKEANKGSMVSNAPWSAQQPYFQDIFNLAQQAQRNPSEYTEIANNMIAQRAMAGSPLTAAAQDALMPTLQGAYLDPTTNPIWGPMSSRLADAYATGTAAQTDAAFNRAGAFGLGNSAYEEAVGRNQQNFGDALAGLAGNIFNQERGRQMQGINIAPFIAQSQYADADRLQQLGETSTWGPLFNYQKLISGNLGGQATQSGGYTGDPISGALGGALLGNQLYQGFNQPSNQYADWAVTGSSTPYSGGYGWGNV